MMGRFLPAAIFCPSEAGKTLTNSKHIRYRGEKSYFSENYDRCRIMPLLFSIAVIPIDASD